MNQFFSFKRFQLLVLKHWADNKKRYSLSILAFAGLLIVWFLFTMLLPEDTGIMSEEVQQLTFFFTLFAVGTFYASQYFGDFGSRPNGSNFLLVPASTFEKFLCSLLYTVLLFFVVFTAAFYLADILIVSISNAVSATDGLARKPTVINVLKVNLIWLSDDTAINMVLFFLSIQSLFLLGAVHFKKYSFIKTIITGFVAYLILFSVTFFLYRRFVPGGDRPDGPVHIAGWIPQVLRFLVYLIAPVSWMVTYYRLKGKQV